jgi:mono/diheme cytochrome c family protein
VTNRGLAVAAILAAALLVLGCSAEGDRPATTIFPDMMESVPHDTFEDNPLSPAGGMLLPPEGTVPVGGMPFAYGATEEEAIRAGLEMANPLLPSAENLAVGQHQFDSACSVCHGKGGVGDGPIIGRFPNPPSLLAEHAKSYPDGRIYHVITRGQGIMPPHDIQVLPLDRWRVVLYLRQLQGLLVEESDPATGEASAVAGAAAGAGEPR